MFQVRGLATLIFKLFKCSLTYLLNHLQSFKLILMQNMQKHIGQNVLEEQIHLSAANVERMLGMNSLSYEALFVHHGLDPQAFLEFYHLDLGDHL